MLRVKCEYWVLLIAFSSPMLSSGVDRIVEQVVNPKIHKVFKPQIDKVLDSLLNYRTLARIF